MIELKLTEQQLQTLVGLLDAEESVVSDEPVVEEPITEEEPVIDPIAEEPIVEEEPVANTV